MKRNSVIITILLVISFNLLYGQNDSIVNIKIVINQKILPGPNPDIEYHIKKNRIKVYSVDNWGKNWKAKELLYFGFLKSSTIDSIKIIIATKDFKSFDEYYSGGVIDGIVWTFVFRTPGLRKEIMLNNYYLKELDEILELLNKEIPEKERLIHFEWLNIKREHQNK